MACIKKQDPRLSANRVNVLVFAGDFNEDISLFSCFGTICIFHFCWRGRGEGYF